MMTHLIIHQAIYRFSVQIATLLKLNLQARVKVEDIKTVDILNTGA